MRSNHVKRKLIGGGVSIGTFLFEFTTTGIARITAEAGAEFAIFDMEHTGWSIETIRMLIATSRSTEMVPVVRVPATEYHFIARVLDMGAMGIMVPMVEGEEQARRIVQSAKYPPGGRRGAAFGVAHDDYTGGDMAEKIRSANGEQLLIAQSRDDAGRRERRGDRRRRGPRRPLDRPGRSDDLAGHSRPVHAPGVPGGRRCVVEACHTHGKVLGYLALDIEDGRAMLAQGFRMLAYGGDLWLYQQAVRQGVAALQAAARGAS